MSEQPEQDYPPYSIVINWEPLDRIFVVTVPELLGCATHGRTHEEAVRQGRDALESWVDAARADGEELPRPREYSLA